MSTNQSATLLFHTSVVIQAAVCLSTSSIELVDFSDDFFI